MYVYTYACMYVYICIGVYACIHACMLVFFAIRSQCVTEIFNFQSSCLCFLSAGGHKSAYPAWLQAYIFKRCGEKPFFTKLYLYFICLETGRGDE